MHLLYQQPLFILPELVGQVLVRAITPRVHGVMHAVDPVKLYEH